MPESLEFDAAAVGLGPLQAHRPTVAEEVVAAHQRAVPFHVILVQIPQTKRDQVVKIWNYLREDTLDSATVLRLHNNGLRVGVGNVEWWEPLRAAFAAIEGHRTSQPEPWRIPQRYPLNLELTEEPREHTVFYVAADGVLGGDIWPDSRCALQLTHELDLLDSQRDRVTILPVVRRAQSGWRRIRTESGLWSVPREDGRAYPEAAFTVGLDPGEYLVIAPSDTAGIPGLLGATFLTHSADTVVYEYYVIIRPDVRDAGPDD